MLVEEKLLFDGEAIRDTADHNSVILDIRWGQTKSMIFESSLNQDVTVSVYGSRNADMSNSFLKASFPITATTNTIQDCDCYFPYMRIIATCSVAPTSGTLTIAAYTIGV